MFGIFLLIEGVLLVAGFPDGAPSDTCVHSRANQPRHGASRPQSTHSLPYKVKATTDSYNPGQQIHGMATLRTK